MNLAPLKKYFHGELLVDRKTLDTYSRDYSLFKVTPEVIACPTDAEDVKTLVHFATKQTLAGQPVSLTGRSAGTDMTGGPLNDSIIVSFTPHLNHIKELTKAFVQVEPGVYFRDLEPRLIAKGLLYPPYPASKDLCAIGGMIANNSGGEKTLAYGKTEKFVQELKVILSDGEEHTIAPINKKILAQKCSEQTFEGHIYRHLLELLEQHKDVLKKAKPKVSKNSAGYALWNVWDGNTFDLTQLFVGSQGTLGLATEAKLKLVKAKQHSRMAVIFLQDVSQIGDLIKHLLPFKPESIESYDDKTMTIAVKFWRDVLRTMKGDVFKLFWQFLPEMWMVIRGGMPKMVILVELTDESEKRLDQRLHSLKKSIGLFAKTHQGIRIRLLKNVQESEKYWAIRRHSFALLHNHSKDKSTAPFIDDFAVEPKYLAKFLPELNSILDTYKDDLIYTIAGHPGDGNFHIIPLMDLRSARVRALIPIISAKVYKLVLKYHGTITAEHNDGLIRTPYLEMMYGPEIVELFVKVKNLFDPLNIFNPGKKVGGSLKYSLEHVVKKN